jgi:4-carboxymuconolactone decarboxylase
MSRIGEGESMTSSDAFERGMKVRREVLGDAHVDQASRNITAFDARFQSWITESAWAGVWDDPTLDRRTRSLVTIAILGALRSDELELHLNAARNTGASAEEIAEVLMHVGLYAGVPAANTAFRVANQIYAPQAEPYVHADESLGGDQRD